MKKKDGRGGGLAVVRVGRCRAHAARGGAAAGGNSDCCRWDDGRRLGGGDRRDRPGEADGGDGGTLRGGAAGGLRTVRGVRAAPDVSHPRSEPYGVAVVVDVDVVVVVVKIVIPVAVVAVGRRGSGSCRGV